MCGSGKFSKFFSVSLILEPYCQASRFDLHRSIFRYALTWVSPADLQKFVQSKPPFVYVLRWLATKIQTQFDLTSSGEPAASCLFVHPLSWGPLELVQWCHFCSVQRYRSCVNPKSNQFVAISKNSDIQSKHLVKNAAKKLLQLIFMNMYLTERCNKGTATFRRGTLRRELFAAGTSRRGISHRNDFSQQGHFLAGTSRLETICRKTINFFRKMISDDKKVDLLKRTGCKTYEIFLIVPRGQGLSPYGSPPARMRCGWRSGVFALGALFIAQLVARS